MLYFCTYGGSTRTILPAELLPAELPSLAPMPRSASHGTRRPMVSVALSVNHTLPSGPVVMPLGLLAGSGKGKICTAPLRLMRPSAPPLNFRVLGASLPSVNQRLPSGPVVIPAGMLF